MRIRTIAPVMSLGVSLAFGFVSAQALGGGEEPVPAAEQNKVAPAFTPSLDIDDVSARYDKKLGSIIFQMGLKGQAGQTKPEAIGQRDGAPILAYLFYTDLLPKTVGFENAHGTLALAVMCHPDFDCTPLWDENMDGVYTNDGAMYQTCWIVLSGSGPDGAGMSVARSDSSQALPPTACMPPLCMDSPGFNVVLDGDELRVAVPTRRIAGNTTVGVHASTALLHLHEGAGRDTEITVDRVYDEYHPK